MKYLLLAFLLSGCATVGNVLKAAGEGGAKASQDHQDTIHCNTDYAGGYNCQ